MELTKNNLIRTMIKTIKSEDLSLYHQILEVFYNGSIDSDTEKDFNSWLNENLN